MAVVVPSGQSSQLVGLPRLSDETYRKLGETMRKMYVKYQELASTDPSDYYAI